MIVVESKKKSLDGIKLEYPDAVIIDVTSQGEGGWIKLSPFYPHGGIPVPFSPGYMAESVEGIWQGLKVFEHEGVSKKAMSIMSMKGIKRSAGKKLGACLGHQKGLLSTELLGYIEARKQIYVPAYEWILENRCSHLIQKLREYSAMYVVVLLDYDTNADIENPKKPLSHASLIVRYIVSRLTEEEKAEWKVQAEENARLSAMKKAQTKDDQKKAAEKAAADDILKRQEHDQAMLRWNPSRYTPIWIREQFEAGVQPSFLQFFRPSTPRGAIGKAYLSQRYPCSFKVDGITYTTIEQYLQAEKERISQPEEWNKQLFDLAVKGNYAKFEQNESLRNFLLETKDRILVETNPDDLVWGVGLKEGQPEVKNPDLWSGCNLMGFVLMVVRDMIRRD